MVARVLVLVLVCACSRSSSDNDKRGAPAAAEAKPRGFRAAPWLAGARAVVALSNVGGAPLIIAGGKGRVDGFRIDGKRMSGATGVGFVQRMELLDVRGDAAPELVVAWGRGRGALNVPARLTIHDPADLAHHVDTVALPETTRADVRGISSAGSKGVLWVAAFNSKFMTSLLRVSRGDTGWRAEQVASARVVLDLSVADVDGDGIQDVFVARPYGDDKGTPGMVGKLQDGGFARLPVVGGARAVLATPRGVVVADGWNRRYGRFARALISRLDYRDGRWQRTQLAHVPKRHGYARLRGADIDGDKQLDVVAVGDGPVVWVPVAGGSVRQLTQPTGRVSDAYPVDIDGDGKDEVVIVGESPGIWGLAAVSP